MALHLNAVGHQLGRGDDAVSIGLILCTRQDATVAKFALHRRGAPIAVADWQTEPQVQIAEELPAAVRDELPGLPEGRDQLTTHAADTAERVTRASLRREMSPTMSADARALAATAAVVPPVAALTKRRLN